MVATPDATLRVTLNTAKPALSGTFTLLTARVGASLFSPVSLLVSSAIVVVTLAVAGTTVAPAGAASSIV